MRLVRAGALVAALAALGPGLPAGAGAQPLQLRFGYRAGHGYRVAVSASSSTVILSVYRPEPRHHRGAGTHYLVRGSAAPGHVAARFGDLGRLAMRFRPAGPWQPVFSPSACLGGRELERRRGLFSGRLRFRGEGGYLTTSAHRVSGEELSASHCRRSASTSRAHSPVPSLPQTLAPPQTGPGPFTRLLAGFREGPLAREFEASLHPGRPPTYLAIEEDVVGRLGTYRVAYARAPRGAFGADARLSSAGLSGAGPFTGAARLSRAANGTRSWTGTLAVSFLGEPDVPLTGPQFRTRLSRGF